MERYGKNLNVMFVSLGCDKNLVDTEMMLGMLVDNGHSITQDELEAEVIVVNTCCFIHDAKEESIVTLLELGKLKVEGRLKLLIAAGCLAQRYHKEMKEEIPEVDVLIGTMAIDHICEVIEQFENGIVRDRMESIDATPVAGKKRIVTTGGHYAYLKIAEGCNKRCTYCVIPSVRGSYRSIPMETLISEAKELVNQGVKELILVAQETTMYGLDLYKEKRLPKLLDALCEIEGLYWIRLLYSYPEEITDELIETIARQDKICNYLDMPIQHASDQVLKKMGRRTSNAQLREVIQKLRTAIPDISIRTTLISGFPGETLEDHEIAVTFVNEMKFDRLGVFTYSREEGTKAAIMVPQIDEDVKEERRGEIMEAQQEIAFSKAEDMIGKTVLAMIEGKIADESAYVGRTFKDAPNVDGFIFINTDEELMTGDFVKVFVTGSYEYDLIGEIENEFTK